jgi:ribosome maturation factor RimP
MAAVDAVRGLADEAASAAGLVVEDVAVLAAGRRRVVRVVVDLPEDAVGGVPLDAVAAVSQSLSQRLDDADAMGGAPYTLEVSSPGVDRPLSDRRHWARARGRLVRVALRDGGTRTGRLDEVDDDGVILDGAGLAWSDVARGKVEVEFSRTGDVAHEAPDVLADELAGTDDEDETLTEDEEEGGEA